MSIKKGKMKVSNQDSMEKALKTVLENAWDDKAFLAKLVANPHDAMQSLGYDVPSDVKLVVNDQTDSETIYLNISPKPNLDDMELNDEQLESVAGGEFIFSWFAPTFWTQPNPGLPSTTTRSNDSGW